MHALSLLHACRQGCLQAGVPAGRVLAGTGNHPNKLSCYPAALVVVPVAAEIGAGLIVGCCSMRSQLSCATILGYHGSFPELSTIMQTVTAQRQCMLHIEECIKRATGHAHNRHACWKSMTKRPDVHAGTLAACGGRARHRPGRL
jgi:hypothetical protein